MSGYTLKEGFADTYDGWQDVLAQIMAVTSYKTFFQVTSPHSPVVVKNDPSYAPSNDRNQCHMNCKIAEESGLGKHISGWYLMCEYIFNEFPTGMCRLVHHSNILLPDGTFINPTDDQNSYHIFIRDDRRVYNFRDDVGYNDRMVLGDEFMKGQNTREPVPRNKVLYSANEYYDRDLKFEKFKRYATKEEAYAQVPQSLSEQDKIKWLTLKTNAHAG